MSTDLSPSRYERQPRRPCSRSPRHRCATPTPGFRHRRSRTPNLEPSQTLDAPIPPPTLPGGPTPPGVSSVAQCGGQESRADGEGNTASTHSENSSPAHPTTPITPPPNPPCSRPSGKPSAGKWVRASPPLIHPRNPPPVPPDHQPQGMGHWHLPARSTSPAANGRERIGQRDGPQQGVGESHKDRERG